VTLLALLFAVAAFPAAARLGVCRDMPCCAPPSAEHDALVRLPPCCAQGHETPRTTRPPSLVEHDPSPALASFVVLPRAPLRLTAAAIAYNASNRQTEPLYRMHCALLL
jgi:hypothetical protein